MNDAVREREEGIIFRSADVPAGVKRRAALPDNDPAREHRLAAEHFHAQSLAGRLSTVANRALTFLMSHAYFTDAFRKGTKGLIFGGGCKSVCFSPGAA
jgi:hypothetical protein